MGPISVVTEKPFLVAYVDDRRFYYPAKRWTEQRIIDDVTRSIAAEGIKPETKKKKKNQPLPTDTGIFN